LKNDVACLSVAMAHRMTTGKHFTPVHLQVALLSSCFFLSFFPFSEQIFNIKIGFDFST